MLSFDEGQVAALREVPRGLMPARLAAHAREIAPAHCATLEPDALRAAVAAAVARGRGCGFERAGALRLFVELSLLLGSGFDADPQYPWAAQALADRAAPNEMFRAGRLRTLAGGHGLRVAGRRGARLRAAAPRFLALIAAPPPALLARPVAEACGAALADAYPAKAAATPAEAVAAAARRAEALAASAYGEAAPAPCVTLALTLLMFGAEADRDPFLPWIGTALARDPATGAPADPARLVRRLKAWLTAMAGEAPA